jgi:CheY-like chemotaxis protein
MAVILIVEDNVFIRKIAVMMIQDWGHQTLSASDVEEALSLLRSPQRIDALFTDIYLKTESAKVPEKRGSDYVAIFVRQLGGTIVPSKQEPTGTTVRIRLPLLLVPSGGTERAAA